ncbi:MAG: GntR family transcriptional regulator [Anaerolineae bacterium]
MTTTVNTNQKTSKEPRFQTLYRQMREHISLLQYPPGTVLRESALAEEFGVSRTPIRRVLHRLEFDGLVHISRGTGAVVAAVDIKSLKEVYALRLKLAELIGELNPSRLRRENLAVLEELLTQTKQMQDEYDPVALARLYNEFHQEMLNIIGNEPLKQISDQLFHRTARVWLQLLPDLDWEEEVHIVCEEIGDVLAGLRAGDMQAVARIRRNHMAKLLQRINDYLGSANTE